jgi:hypothetical protein
MMKKILVVFTLLAMASVANAGFLISVNGVVNPPDSTIELKPSETAVIDIQATVNGAKAFDMWLLIQGSLGTMTGGSKVFGNAAFPSQFTKRVAPHAEIDFLNTYYPGTTYATHIIVTGGYDDNDDPIPVDNVKIVDLIEFHCEAEGDVTLILVDVPEAGGLGQVWDRQVIHQIPEPITFALLGLGGLFLRRRK